MPDKTKVLLCFKRPLPDDYIGGLVTLCNNYIDKKDIFAECGIDISCFNYELPVSGRIGNIRNSKARNIIYGFKQIQSLKRYLSVNDCTVHIHTSRKALFFKDVLLACRIRKKCRGKIFMTIHVGDISTVFHNAYTQQFLIRIMNRSIDKVLFLSEFMRRQFVEAGLKESRSEVLYNFYNVRPTTPEDKPVNHKRRFLYLGSINREKGILELMAAFSEIDDDFHVDLCGFFLEEDIKEPFLSSVAKLGDKATYHGYVNKERKEELLRRADVLVLPSYREGLPISILEAMANSCAVITTPVGAIPELFDGRNAVIIPPRNVEALKIAISLLIKDTGLLNLMKTTNYSASSVFNDTSHIKKLCRLYKQ